MTMRLSSILMTAAAVLLAAGCKPAAETAENETLVKLRKAVDAGKYMYAHQDDLCYGHDGWYQVEGGSDVKYVCGDYPAVVGFDLGDIEHADSLHNIDGVSFDVYDDLASVPYVGVGFVVRYMEDGVTSYVPVILKKVKFNDPEITAATQTESIDWQTQSLEGTIRSAPPCL